MSSLRPWSLAFAFVLGCRGPEQTNDDEAEETGSETTDESEGTDESTGEDVACAGLRIAIEAEIQGYLADPTVGLVASVDTGTCEPWTMAWGDANVDVPVPLTNDHLLRAGSVTKSYTAALILRLAEEGLLSLDDTLDLWGIVVPDAAAISIRQLLNHTSGLADYQYSSDFKTALQTDPERVWMPQELIDYAVALGPVAIPGEQHSYANTNYVIAGLIVEAASQQTYAEALRERILEPAMLSHTYVEGDETWDEPFATGYLSASMGPPQDTTGYYHASQVWSAGAIVTTAEQLRAWITVLLASDFLEPESQSELVDLVPADGVAGYGLGVFAVESGDVVAYGHNGAVMGFQSTVFYDPGTGTSVAILQNQISVDDLGNLVVDPTTLAGLILETVAAESG